eukprot:558579-Amphidinium_carterae.1
MGSERVCSKAFAWRNTLWWEGQQMLIRQGEGLRRQPRWGGRRATTETHPQRAAQAWLQHHDMPAMNWTSLASNHTEWEERIARWLDIPVPGSTNRRQMLLAPSVP